MQHIAKQVADSTHGPFHGVFVQAKRHRECRPPTIDRTSKRKKK